MPARIAAILLTLLMVVLPALSGADPSFAQQEDRKPSARPLEKDAVRDISARASRNAGEPWIVETDPSAGDPGALADRLSRQHGIAVTHVYRVAATGFAALMDKDAAKALRSEPGVRSVQPATEVKMMEQTIPPGISRIEAAPLGKNAVARIDGIDQRVDADVAIIDSGIDRTHPDLNYAGGYDCTAAVQSPGTDENGHGTHVAGTVAALDNGIGVVGVAPGARLWSVKIFDETGSASGAELFCALDWVALNASVIDAVNMSLGGGGSDSANCGGTTDTYHQRICAIVDAGVPIAVAAGNSGMNAATFLPAAYDEVITVSAIIDTDGIPGGLGPSTSRGPDDALASFSNYGPDVDLAAPGVNVLSTQSGGGYLSLSGTSMATPHVAGGMALYRAANPGASPDAVRAWLMGNREDIQIANDPDLRSEGVLNVNDGLPWGAPPINGPDWTPVPPANDERSGAVAIDPALGETVTRNAWFATANASDPAACDRYGASTWYAFTPDADLRIVLDTEGTRWDTLLAIYEEQQDSSLAMVACNDDVDNAAGIRTSKVKFTASAGKRYLVMTGGWGTTPSESLTLSARSISGSVSNDEPAGAIFIDLPLPHVVSMDASLATRGENDPALTGCAANYSDSVWYRIQPGSTDQITVSSYGSTYDTLLAVFRDQGGTMAQVACNDNGTPRLTTSRVSFTPAANAVYYLMAASAGQGAETLSLWLGYTPLNDQPADAIELTAFPASDARDVSGATWSDADSVPAGCQPYNGSVWYSLSPGRAGTVTVATAGSDFDTVLMVYRIENDAAVFVGCNDDANAPTDRTSVLDFAVDGQSTYLIAAAAWSGLLPGKLAIEADVDLSGDPPPTPTPSPEPTQPTTPDPAPTATPVPGRDTVKPTVTIIDPRNRERLRRLGQVRVRANDPGGGIARVQIFACTGDPGCIDRRPGTIGSAVEAPWTVAVERTFRPGTVTLIARATDRNGNVGESRPVTMTIAKSRNRPAAACEDRDAGGIEPRHCRDGASKKDRPNRDDADRKAPPKPRIGDGKP